MQSFYLFVHSFVDAAVPHIFHIALHLDSNLFLMNDGDNVGGSVNLTSRLVAYRNQHLDQVVPVRGKVLAEFQLLSHTYSEEKEFKAWYSKHASQANSQKVSQCQHCGNKFGFLEAKNVCGLCSRIVCPKDSYLQPLIDSTTISVPVCRRCHTFIKFHNHQTELRRKIKEEQNSLMVIMYGTVIAIKAEIVSNMPKFKGIMFSLISIYGDSPQDLENLRSGHDDGKKLTFPPQAFEELFAQAQATQTTLKSVYDALQERLAGIQSASSDSKAQQKVVANLKQAMADFLTTNLPDFKFNSSRLFDIKTHPKTKRWTIEAKEMIAQEELAKARKAQEEADMKRFLSIVGSYHPVSRSPSGTVTSPGHESSLDMMKATGSKLLHGTLDAFHKLESKNTSHFIPEISGVVPALCPTFGGVPLTLRGQNFHPQIRVFFGNTQLDSTQVLYVSHQELKVISPKVEEEGPADIYVQNPNQQVRGALEGILFFTQDPAVLETIFGTPKTAIEPTPLPSSSFIRSHSSPLTSNSSGNPFDPSSPTLIPQSHITSSSSNSSLSSTSTGWQSNSRGHSRSPSVEFSDASLQPAPTSPMKVSRTFGSKS